MVSSRIGDIDNDSNRAATAAFRLSAVHEQHEQQQADALFQRQLRAGLLRKSSSLRHPPPQTDRHCKQPVAYSHCNTIDVGESDIESDSDWVASDYQDSDVASSSTRDSMPLVSHDGGVVREDVLYILTNSNASQRQHFDLLDTPTSSRSFDPPFLHKSAAARHKRARAQQQQRLDGNVPDTPRLSATSDDAESLASSHPNVSLFSRQRIGLLVSLAFASMLTSCLKRGVLPLMQAEMAMAPYQVDATKILLMLPWSCALLVGFVSDVFPIYKSHRKAYMMLGWAVTALALLAMALLNHSFNVNGRLQQTSSMAASDRNAVVAVYIALLGVACFGGITSVIVAEIYVVALSQREVLKRRGVVVGAFLLVQFFFEGVGQAVTDHVAFQFTAAGKMSPYYTLAGVLTFLTGYAIVPIPVLYWLFDDHLESTRGRIGECDLLEDEDDDDDEKAYSTSSTHGCVQRIQCHGRQLWQTLAEKATWHTVGFLCVFIFFTEFTLKYPFTVLDKWAGVTPKTTSQTKIVAEAMYFAAALAWLVTFRHRNWNYVVVGSYLGVFLFPSMAYYLSYTFSSSGAIELYMIVGSLHGFVRGLAVILEVAMTVEIAKRGFEGALLGAVVSIASVIRLVSETTSNMIGWLFGTQFLAQDTGTMTKDEPMLVATALILCYTIRLLALVGVLVLPSQKIALLRLRFLGGRKARRAWLTVAIFVVSMLTSSIINSLVITPDTMCLPVFGGKGCSSHNDRP